MLHYFFSIHNYINVITIRCPFQDTQSAILGLNWCILLGLFIFPALAKGSCYLLFPLGNEIRDIMHLNVKFPYAVINQILQITQSVCLNGLMCIKLIQLFRTLYGIFMFSLQKCIYLLLLLIFFLFQIKNLWFSSQRRREVVGDANGSISK